MYAIVEIGAQQYKVEEGNKIYVHKLSKEEGSKIEFDRVLLVDNDGKVQVGTPVVAGAKIEATVLEEVKGDKVIVFKKKRRKGYKKKNGHRQQYTRIEIRKIVA
jgi:large subunit ribosomal protein L21